jgi:hypothetical protein
MMALISSTEVVLKLQIQTTKEPFSAHESFEVNFPSQ